MPTRKKTFVVVISSLTLILLSPIGLVSLKYPYLLFDPAAFITGYWHFFLTLISTFFGFALLNIFWVRQQHQVLISRIRGKVISNLRELLLITHQARLRLSKGSTEEDAASVSISEEYLLRLFHKLSYYRQDLMLNLPEDVVIQNIPFKLALRTIWIDVIPSMDVLIDLRHIYPDTEKIAKTVDCLERDVNGLLSSLGVPEGLPVR